MKTKFSNVSQVSLEYEYTILQIILKEGVCIRFNAVAMPCRCRCATKARNPNPNPEYRKEQMRINKSEKIINHSPSSLFYLEF